MFIHGSPLQPKLMFVGKNRSLNASLGYAPASHANLLGTTNTLAYYGRNKFHNIDLRVNVIKLFFNMTNEKASKLECLFMAKFYRLV